MSNARADQVALLVGSVSTSKARAAQVVLLVGGPPGNAVAPDGVSFVTPLDQTFPFFGLIGDSTVTALGGIASSVPLDNASYIQVVFAQPFDSYCYVVVPEFVPTSTSDTRVVIGKVINITPTGFQIVGAIVSGTAGGTGTFTYAAVGI